ncbi:MAG: putative glycine dehydrogenase (decarboxylating) subunit 1 [Candidatus Binatia bacterium]|nr:MAG: putative glycine dehydrogenase (decarboxylating) subunit 1 [Candidatus Binatia bacterium]
MRFLPHTPDDVAEMLRAVGVSSIDELLADVPKSLRERAQLRIGPSGSEQEVLRRLEEKAEANPGAKMPCFLGAGAYPHFVPAVVDHVLSRAEFWSAYTPYQPEVSQGTLQAAFEFQSLVATLFGMEVANASLYDGASAAAEAVLMARRLAPNRERVVLSSALHPQVRAVVRTYLDGLPHVEVAEVPWNETGSTDVERLGALCDENTSAVVVGYPNVFGILEDLAETTRVASRVGARVVSVTLEPLALALFRPPGDFGVDIAVGEGQSFGLPLSYGGPGLGLFATKEAYVRAMPGRLVGQTVDARGKRGFVLTLATREQHIRRERATSNVCTNHALGALAATVYLSLLGKRGLRALAQMNYRRAHEVAERLVASGRWQLRFPGVFFNEFVLAGADADEALRSCARAGVLGGFPLGRWYPELAESLLVCVTELPTDEEIERLVRCLA